jgi:hypothetical protein
MFTGEIQRRYHHCLRSLTDEGKGIMPTHNPAAGSVCRLLVLSHQDIEEITEGLHGQNRAVWRESLGERKRRISHRRSVDSFRIGQDVGIQCHSHRSSSYSSSRVQRPTL